MSEGKEKSAVYFKHDHTHSSLAGARLNAAAISQDCVTVNVRSKTF